MARGAGALGWLAAALIALTLAPVAAVALRAGGGVMEFSATDVASLRFTVLQAALSALLAVGLAVPVARALARRRFPGRGLMVTALGAPFLLPVIVAILGLLSVFGRSGWLAQGLALIGLSPPSIYGLQGVVLSHVFFNLPLAVRLILAGWQAIPAERVRLASALDLGPGPVFWHLEVPMLREVIPGALLLIFTLCLSSFAIALTMGGGPAATTVELAIYQALRFDFDLSAAARLALVQVAICGLAFAAASRLTLAAGFGAGLGRSGVIAAPSGWRRVGDALAIGMAALFLGLPLLAVVVRGLPGLLALPPEIWPAALRSVAVALGATAVTILLALPLAFAAAAGGRVAALAATLPLAVSALVLGTGLFLILRPIASPGALALPVTLGVNALLALPFAFRILAPEVRRMVDETARLAAALGLPRWVVVRWAILPGLARPIGFAAGLSAALAMGDLGVIALFAGETEATLPLVQSRLMGAFRMEAAAAAALILTALSFALFALFDRIGSHVAS